MALAFRAFAVCFSVLAFFVEQANDHHTESVLLLCTALLIATRPWPRR